MSKINFTKVASVAMPDAGLVSMYIFTDGNLHLKLENGSEIVYASGSSFVAKAGDTMTGPLILPSNGLTVGTSQLTSLNGNIGINEAAPSHQLHVTLPSNKNIFIDASTNPRTITDGVFRIEQKAGVQGTRALHIQTDANGFGDSRSILSQYKATNIASGMEAHCLEINVDTGASTGGEFAGLSISKVNSGGILVAGLETYAGVDPIVQHAGIEVSTNTVFNYDGAYNDVTTSVASPSTNVQLFTGLNNYLYLGHTIPFNQINIILSIPASDSGITPTFEYSKGAGVWQAFFPTDGTNGFRDNGAILFESTAIPLWSTDAVNSVPSLYWIRIKRTAATLVTAPTESYIKLVAATEYKWDKDAALTINTIAANNLYGPLTGNVTGNASTATILETTRTISGVSFNGSVNIQHDTSNINFPSVGPGGAVTTEHAFTNTQSTGWTEGGAITDIGGGNVSIASGTGYIRSTNSNNGSLFHCAWSAVASHAIATDTDVYVYVDYNAGSPLVAYYSTLQSDLNTKIFLGEVHNLAGVLTIHFVPRVSGDVSSRLQAWLEGAVGNLVQSGGIFADAAPASRKVAISSCGFFAFNFQELVTAAFNSTTGGLFKNYYRDGASGWLYESAQTDWENTKIDTNTGTLVVMTANYYANRWVMLNFDGSIGIMYGQAEYATQALAESEVAPNLRPTILGFDDHGFFIARITFLKGAASFVSVLDLRPRIAAVAGSGSGGGGTSIHNDLTGIQGGQAAQYYHINAAELAVLQATSGTNTGDQTNISGNAGTATTLQTARNIAGVSFNGSAAIAVPLVNLSDISITTPTVDQVLKYNGTVWYNAPNTSGSSAGAGITYYPQGTVVTAAGTENAIDIDSLEKFPDPNNFNSVVTITIANPAVVSWVAHPLKISTPIIFTTTGTLPTGITAGIVYYVITAGFTVDSFEFSTSFGGAPVTTTGTQSGVHTATAQEELDSVTVNASTGIIGAYLDGVLNRTTIDGGAWTFHTYAGVDSTAAVSEIIRNINRVRVQAETVTITGTGISRTATASAGTPFNTTDIIASSDSTLASFIQTPKGLYQITGRTSDTIVTIATPTGYINETTVTMNVWFKLFGASTGEINNISPAYGLFESSTIQPAFTILATDKLGVMFYGKTTRTSNTLITFVHSGTAHYSHFDTPLSTMHNELSGLQGGSTDQKYHLTSAQATNLTTAWTDGSILYGNGTGISQDNTNLKWDSVNKRLGIGVAAPINTLDLNSAVAVPTAILCSSEEAVSGYYGTVANSTAANGTRLSGARSRGTLAAPSATLSGDVFLRIIAKGYGATGFPTSARTWVDFFATENWTDTAQGSAISFNTTITGGVSQGERMRIHGNGYVGIGVAAPTQQLEITGAFAMPATSTSTTGVIYKGTTRYEHNFTLAGTTGQNTFSGLLSGNFTMTGSTGAQGSNLTGYGYNTLTAVTTGYSNTAIGSNSLAAITTGYENLAIGAQASQLQTGGLRNLAIGAFALGTNLTGHYNTAVGFQALYTQKGSGNTAVGFQALVNQSSGVECVAVGYQALRTATNHYGTALGYFALYDCSTGAGNTAVGDRAGYNSGVVLSTISNCTFLGKDAIASADALTNSMALGYQAQVTASNQVVIGNASVTQTLLKGSVGIGTTTTPSTTLDIQSSSATGQLQLFKLTGGDNYTRFNMAGSASSTDYWQIAANATNTTTTSILSFYTAVGGLNVLSILGDGKVGINTTAPNANLHVGRVSSVAAIIVGDYPNSATDVQVGTRTMAWSTGSIYFDAKTYTAGMLVYRCGAGTEACTARTYQTVDASTGNINHYFANATAGFTSASPATGGTVTGGANTSGIFITPAGTIATCTIKLPPASGTGMLIWVACSQIITTVTWQDAGSTAANVIGGPTTIGGTGRGTSFVYEATTAKWYNIG